MLAFCQGVAMLLLRCSEWLPLMAHRLTLCLHRQDKTDAVPRDNGLFFGLSCIVSHRATSGVDTGAMWAYLSGLFKCILTRTVPHTKAENCGIESVELQTRMAQRTSKLVVGVRWRQTSRLCNRHYWWLFCGEYRNQIWILNYVVF